MRGQRWASLGRVGKRGSDFRCKWPQFAYSAASRTRRASVKLSKANASLRSEVFGLKRNRCSACGGTGVRLGRNAHSCSWAFGRRPARTRLLQDRGTCTNDRPPTPSRGGGHSAVDTGGPTRPTLSRRCHKLRASLIPAQQTPGKQAVQIGIPLAQGAPLRLSEPLPGRA